MEIVNFSDFLLEKKEKKSKINKPEEGSPVWKEKWNIPINPERVKTVSDCLELSVRHCKISIDSINRIFSDKDQEKSKESISNLGKQIDLITELKGGKDKGGILGKAYEFWKDWEASIKKYNSAVGKEEEEKIHREGLIADVEKSELSGIGITDSDNKKFLEEIEKSKGLIKLARESVDSGDISKSEYSRNIEKYSKDKDGVEIGFQEGMKKVMYETIKEAISDFQSSIDNYIKALDEYKNVYEDFMEGAKENYRKKYKKIS